MSISQGNLEQKFDTFLKTLGEENIEKYAGGLCNAFAIVVLQRSKSVLRL